MLDLSRDFGRSINTSAQSIIIRHLLCFALINISGRLSLLDSLGSHATSESPRILLISLIHVVKVFEQIVGEIPKRSARSSFNKASRNLIRVNNISSRWVNFFVFGTILKFRFTLLYLLVRFAPLQYRNLGKYGVKNKKSTLNIAIDDSPV